MRRYFLPFRPLEAHGPRHLFFRRLTFPALALAGMTLLWSACNDLPSPSEGYDMDALPLAMLSDYGLFEGDLAELEPGPWLMPYTLNTPLFTDYAYKARHIYLPPGERMRYLGPEALEFPVGTMIFKTFYYPEDFRQPEGPRRILETRVLALHSDGWQAYGYRWNDEQTDAESKVTGKVLDVSWIDALGDNRNTNYIIPNVVECENCHQIGDPLQPLGPKPRNLNGLYPYASGEANQLAHWSAEDWLENAPDPSTVEALPVFGDPGSGSLDLRARAYLDINCAHCHRPEGDAENSGLYLNLENADDAALGICKTPVAAGGGSGGLRYAISPGEPDSSILMYRMISNDLDVAMPELGRTVQHDEGVALIRDWIAALPGEPCE
jgi:uncharacterized repeat protein (TIGR03806 family)